MDFDIPADIQATLDALDAFIEQEIAPAPGPGRQRAVLRPPPGVGPHRLRERRRAPRRLGGAARRDAPALERGRLAAPRPAAGVRRPRRQQPRDGDHPRAPGPQGPGPPQRPAERELDRRQLPDRADDARLRHRRAEGGVDARLPRRHRDAWRSGSPSRTTAPTPRSSRPPRCRTATSGSSTATSGSTPGLHHATHDIIFARTSGDHGSPVGISAFLVPTDIPGFSVDFFWWTFNMPTDHAEVTMTDVRVGQPTRSSVASTTGSSWPSCSCTRTGSARRRRRSARRSTASTRRSPTPTVAPRGTRRCPPTRASSSRSSSCTPRPPCSGSSSVRRRGRWTTSTTWSSPTRWPCATTAPTGWPATPPTEPCRPAAASATRRHMPFEHIYRHHRRYRITEGSEEIQMRKVAQHLFGFGRSARK